MKSGKRSFTAAQLVSLLLCLVMVCSLLPASVLAAGTETAVTPGNTWHAIRFAGNYYDSNTYPYSFVHAYAQAGSSNNDGSDNTPDKIRIIAEDLTMTAVEENGQTYEVRLFALPRTGGTWNVINPTEETYSCDIEITNERNYLLKVVLYDFGIPDPSSTIKDFKKIRNLTVSGNVQVELRNSSVGGVQIYKNDSVTTEDGALLIENTVVPSDKIGETAYYFCDASVTVIPGHTTAGYNFDNPNMLDNCDVTVGRRAALMLDNSANLTLNGCVAKSITVSHTGNEVSAVTFRNITIPETSALSFQMPCTVSLIGATAKGQLIFDGQGQSKSFPFTLALNNATLRESVTVQNYGELTITLAGANALNTYQEIYNYNRGNRPDIMVANDSRLMIQDDPAQADVGSLEIGQPAIDFNSIDQRVLYYDDAGHHYCAAIGGTPSDNPLPHGSVIIKSGVLTAQAQYGGAAIGGSIEGPAINDVIDAQSGYQVTYQGDPSALVAGNGGPLIGDAYYLPNDPQFDPNNGGYWLKKDSFGDYCAVVVKPGFTRDGGTVRIEGGIVNVTATGGGAAIGGAIGGDGGAFVITGGTVNATASMGAAAIGGGAWQFKKDSSNSFVMEGNAPVITGGAGGTINIQGGCVVNCKTENNYYATNGVAKDSFSVSTDDLYAIQGGYADYGYAETRGYVIGPSAVSRMRSSDKISISAKNGVSPVVMLQQNVSNSYMGTTGTVGEVDAKWDYFLYQNNHKILDTEAGESYTPTYINNAVILLIGREFIRDGEGNVVDNQDEMGKYVINTHAISGWRNDGSEQPLIMNNYKVRGVIPLPAWEDPWYSDERFSEFTLPEGSTITLLSGAVMNVASGFLVHGTEEQLVVEDGAVIQGRGIWPGKPPVDPNDTPNPDETRDMLNYLKSLEQQSGSDVGADNAGVNSTSRTIVTHLGIAKRENGERFLIPGDSADEIRAQAAELTRTEGGLIELVTIIDAGYCGFKKVDANAWSLLISNKSTVVSLVENGALSVSQRSGSNPLTFRVTENSGAVTISATNARLCSPDYTVYESKQTDAPFSVTFSSADDAVEISDELAFKIKLAASDNKAVFSVPNFLGSSFSLNSVAPVKDKCALRYGGELSFQTPFANFAGVNINQLQINYDGSIALGGIEGGGEVHVPDFGGFPVSGGAEMSLNTFNGEQEYSLNIELETPIFEGAFEASFKEVRGIVLPDTLYAELAVGEGGIPLVPPTIVGYIQGGGLGFEGLADTIDMDSFGAPPLRLKMAAKGSIVDVIDGWVRLSVGPSGFDLEMEDIEMQGVDLIDAYGISASWDAGTRMVDGTEYWGMNADMNQHLDIKLGYNGKDLVTASGKIGYGGFSGYAKDGSLYHVVIQLEGYGNLGGTVQIPKNLVGPIPPFDFTVASGEIGFYTSIGAKNTINADNINGSAAHILRELVKNTRPFFNAAVGAKAVCDGGIFFPKCYAKVTYVFGDKKPSISAGRGDGGELNLREISNAPTSFSTLTMVEDTETGEMIPAIVEVAMESVATLKASGNAEMAGESDVILRGLDAAPTRGTTRELSATSMYGFEADVQQGAVGNVLIAISSKDPSVPLDSSNLTVKKDGVKVDLVQAVYDENGLTNPDTANFFAGEGVAYFAPTGAGTFTVTSSVEISKVEVIKAVEFATFGSEISATQYSVQDAAADRQYKVQLFLGSDGSADYLLAEKELSGEDSYTGSLSYDLTGDLAPSGKYSPTMVLLEYVSATDENGETVETWSPLDRKTLSTQLTYTNNVTPDAPTNVTLAYSGNGTMTASWDAVTNAESYQISVYDAEGKDTGAMFQVSQANGNTAPENSIVMDFSSLESGKNYSVGVKAQVNVNGNLYTSLEGLSEQPAMLVAANPIALSFSEGVTLNKETGRYSFTAAAAGGSFTVTSTSPLDYSVVNDSTGNVVAEANGATTLTVAVPAEGSAGYDGSLDNAVLRIKATDTTKDYALCYVTVNRDDTAPPLVLDNLGVFPLTRTDAGYVINVTGHTEAGAELIVWEDKFVYTRTQDGNSQEWVLTKGVSANKRAESDGSFSLSLQFDTLPTGEYPTGDPATAESYASYQNYRNILIRAKDAAGNMSDYMRVGFPEAENNTVTVNFDPNGEGASCATSGVILAENAPIGALPVAYWNEDIMLFDGWFTDPVGGTPVTSATAFTAPEPITGSEEAPEGTAQSAAGVIPPVTVYAHWVPSIALTFTVSSETASCDTAALTLKSGTAPGELPVPKQTDDTQMFLGWFTAASGGILVTGDTTFTADTELYARFSEFVTVTFASGVGSSPVSELKVPTGGTISSYPVPTSTGYTFDGWYNGNAAVTAATVYSADTVLTARWTRNTNTTALQVTQAGCNQGETLPDPDIMLPDLPTNKWVGGTSISYVGTGSTSYLGTTKPTAPGSYKVVVQKDTFETAYIGSAAFTIASTTPVFNGQSLLLSGEIGVRFRMSFPAGADMAGSYMDFRVSDGRTSRVAFEASGTAADSSDRVFICYINALELNDIITATFHYGENTVEKTYSAMEYMEEIRRTYTGKDQDELFALLDALQNYGHYLSLTGWTDNRDHAAIAAADTELNAGSLTDAGTAVSGMGIVKNVGDTGIDPANVYFSLTLNAETVINLFIEKTDGLTIASAMDGETELTVTETQMSGKTYYRIKTDPIGAGALDKPRTVTVTTGEAKTATFTVSAMSYVKALLASGSEAEKYAVTAIYRYAEAAKAYAQATNQI